MLSVRKHIAVTCKTSLRSYLKACITHKWVIQAFFYLKKGEIIMKKGKEKKKLMVRRTTKEELKVLLEDTFSGRNLIARHDPVLNTFVAAGTLANADSKGEGIEGSVIIGKGTFYPTPAAIDWLVAKVRE